MWIGQSVSTQLPSVVGWMKELLLGGQQVRRVVHTVQRVEEVDLMTEGGEPCMKTIFLIQQSLSKGNVST